MRRISLRSLVRFLAAVVVATLVWYGQSRLFAARRAVSYHELGTPKAAQTSRDELVVATFNVAHGRGSRFGASNWTGRSRQALRAHLQRLAAHIAAASPDLVVLNEADLDSTWSKRTNQPVVLGESAGFRYVVTQRNVDIALPFVAFRFGNAILSRYPLSDCRRVVFAALSRWERILAGNHDALVCRARTPLGDVRILAVHLEYRSEWTRVACARAIDAIAAEEETPLIVAGDLNTAPRGLPHHQEADGVNALDSLLDGGRFQTLLPPSTAAEHMTFPAEKPDRAIDWILTTPQLKAVSSKVHASQLSDHLMLSVVLRRTDVGE